MHLSINQPTLQKALSLVSKAVNPRSSLPVLSNVLLEATEDGLRIAATNRAIAISVWCVAEVKEPGSTTVPARLFQEFINSLPGEAVWMELNSRTETLRVSTRRNNANIKGISAEDFPILPTIGSSAIELDATILTSMIDSVTFAASGDESRLTLTGVLVSVDVETGAGIEMAATDGYRLATRSNLPLDTSSIISSVIVPSSHLDHLSKLMREADSAAAVGCEISQERSQIIFDLTCDAVTTGLQRIELSSELIDAKYPDYMMIVPKTCDTSVTVTTAELLNALKVAALFARDDSFRVFLRVHGGGVEVKATSPHMGDSCNEVAATVEGDGLEIVFDVRYLIESLNHVNADSVRVEFTHPTRPAQLCPSGMEFENWRHVVMPMFPGNR